MTHSLLVLLILLSSGILHHHRWWWFASLPGAGSSKVKPQQTIQRSPGTPGLVPARDRKPSGQPGQRLAALFPGEHINPAVWAKMQIRSWLPGPSRPRTSLRPSCSGSQANPMDIHDPLTAPWPDT